MHAPQFQILPETPLDAAPIDALQAEAFGPGRFARAAFRLREGARAEPHLSFAAWYAKTAGRALIGSVRFTPVTLSGDEGLLLGPLVVRPDWKGRGCGIALMKRGMDEAAARGARWIVLVGDEPYYARVGFSRSVPGAIRFPGPVDPARILVRELVPGALDGASGELAGIPA